MAFKTYQLAAVVAIVAVLSAGVTYFLAPSIIPSIMETTTLISTATTTLISTMTQTATATTTQTTTVTSSAVTTTITSSIITSTVTSTATLTKAAEAASLEVTPIIHSAVMLKQANYTAYVDPYGKDFSTYPKANLILITHPHPDHLSTSIIKTLSNEDTKVVAPASAKSSLPQATLIQPGEQKSIDGVIIKAIDAYNIERKNQRGEPPHPQGFGIGYVVTIGGKNILFAGDTECTPDLKNQKNMDIAFLPIDGVYTMTPDEAAICYKEITPITAIPYHQNNQDPNKIKEILADTPSIKVEVKPLP